MSNRTGPMVCPVDQTQLVMSDRQGIEIDYCPTCRGVWLDRGELDKIIERNSSDIAAAAAPQQQQQHQGQHQGQHGYGHKPYKKRKSFLDELFD